MLKGASMTIHRVKRFPSCLSFFARAILLIPYIMPAGCTSEESAHVDCFVFSDVELRKRWEPMWSLSWSNVASICSDLYRASRADQHREFLSSNRANRDRPVAMIQVATGLCSEKWVLGMRMLAFFGYREVRCQDAGSPVRPPTSVPLMSATGIGRPNDLQVFLEVGCNVHGGCRTVAFRTLDTSSPSIIEATSHIQTDGYGGNLISEGVLPESIKVWLAEHHDVLLVVYSDRRVLAVEMLTMIDTLLTMYPQVYAVRAMLSTERN